MLFQQTHAQLHRTVFRKQRYREQSKKHDERQDFIVAKYLFNEDNI